MDDEVEPRMEAGRASYLCGTALGFALGFAAAHAMISTRPPSPGSESPVEPAVSSEALPVGDLSVRWQLADPSEEGHAVVALGNLPEASQPAIRPTEPPKPFTPPEDAHPLAAVARQDDATLRSMIGAELEGFSSADREVWYEALRDLSTEDAACLLRLWKMNNSRSPLLDGTLTSLYPPQPAASPATGTTQGGATRDTLRRLHLQNLTHADTPGYKRLDPVFAAGTSSVLETASSDQAHAPVPELVSVRIVLQQGELHQSDRNLDAAIEGPGFFIVRRGAETLYTRCGRFELDSQRRLVIRPSVSCTAVLEPEIVIPPEGRSLTIDSDGTIWTTVAGEAQPQALGTLSLAQFLDATSLESAGDGLYRQTIQSGTAWQESDSGTRDRLRQGYYERSNVSVPLEKAALAELAPDMDAPARTAETGAHPDQNDAPAPVR